MSSNGITAHHRMKCGVFMAPFHRIGENPTLALGRNLELIEWFHVLGYDEAYFLMSEERTNWTAPCSGGTIV